MYDYYITMMMLVTIWMFDGSLVEFGSQRADVFIHLSSDESFSSPDLLSKVTSDQQLVRPEGMSSQTKSGGFYCSGHNSLNFGPIVKIFVPKHISFSRPFI